MRQLTPKERLDLYEWLDEQYYNYPKPGGMCHHIEFYLMEEGFATEADLEVEESCMDYVPEIKEQKPSALLSYGKWFWFNPNDKKSRQFLIQKARARCLRVIQEASISK